MNEKLLTIRQCAKILGYPEYLLRQAAKSGSIPTVKHGNRNYLFAESVKSCLKAGVEIGSNNSQLNRIE